MAEELIYDQVDGGGDPDPLGLRKQLKAVKPDKPDPLGLRQKLSGATQADAPVQPQEQPKAFQVQISQPTHKPTAPVPTGPRTFSYEKPVDPYAKTKLESKAREAQEKLQSELKGNRDVKVKMIKQRRFEQAANEIPLSTSDMPKTNSDIDAGRLIPAAIKPQDLPVTEDDLVKEDADIMADRGKAVRLLEEAMRVDPSRAKEIQKNLYLVDAYNSLTDDEHRVPKIEDNAKKIQKGDVVYDPRSGKLIKPLGLIGAGIEGWKNKSKLFADQDFLTNASDEEIAAELEKRRNSYDPDAAIPVPKGKLAEVIGMLGGQPIKPILGGALASLAGPEAGMAAGSLIGGVEFAKLGYAATFQQVYNELRDQKVSPEEAIQEARSQAKQAALVDGATGVAVGLIGGRMGARPLPVMNFGNGFKQAAFNVLKSTGSELGRAGLEGLAGGAVGAAGQVYKNKLAKEAGIDRAIDEGVLEQIEGNLLATVAMGAAIKAGRGITKPNYKSLLHGLSKMPDEQINSMLQEKVSAGEITQPAADETAQRITDYKALDKLIPDNVTEEARFKIQDKIQKRNELQEQLETTDKAYHPAIKEKIKAIEEDIVGLSKETEKPLKAESGLTKAQEKEAIETAEEFLAEGIFPDVHEAMIKKDPIGFWKHIAQQAQNRDESWRPLREPISESVVRDQFGDTVVDYAKELFPAPEAPEGGVSVIMPGEIKQPETITIAPREQPNDVAPTERVSVIMPKSRGEESLPVGPKEHTAPMAESGETAIPEEVQPPMPPDGEAPIEKGMGEPREVGITHKQMDAIAEEFGLDTYEKSPEKVKEWDEQAAARLQKPDELTSLFNKLRDGIPPDHVETRMMVQYMGDLMAKIDANPTDKALIEQLRRTKDLFNVAGRIQGKSFAARKGSTPVEERLGDFIIRDTEVNKAPLTDEQTATAIKEFEEIKAAKEAFEEKVSKLEAENAKLKAEKIIKQQVSGKSKPRKDFGGERKQIISDIKEKLRKARGETSIVAVPYAKELIAIAPDVVKLAASYIEQGVTELPELVKHIKEAIQEHIPEITDKDVHNIIAGEYNSKKPTRSELAQQLFDLRREAKLVNELEQLQNGAVPKDQKRQIKRNQKIEELKKQIKELRDEMGLNDKTDEEKLSALKGRYKGKIEELEKKLAAGDYGPDEKPKPLELDKEAQELKKKYAELKRERELRLAKQEYENRSDLKKAADFAMNVLNVPRTVMASADFSAPLRQGLVATVSHPTTTMKALPEMFRQAVSQGRFDTWLNNLKESPDYKVIEDSGLYVADPNNLNLSAKEEAYMTNLAEKIPIIGKMVKGSERAYVAYLNKMRVDIFKQGVELFEAQGRTFENSPDLYKGLANYVNNATGRGGLGPLNDAAPVLNTAFFSPRLIASRINLLNPYYYTKLPKEVRIMAIKDMAKVVAFGATILALAQGAGADVEKDPRSSDFGKIKVGNTRWDIWGGFQQYVRLFAQMATGETKSPSGVVRKLDGKSFPYKTRLDQMGNFFRGKLAPVPGTGVDILAGKNVVGEEIEPMNKAYELATPMIIQDVREAWKDQGIKALFTVGVPSALGVGTSTYEPKKPSSSAKNSKGAKKGLDKSLKKELKK